MTNKYPITKFDCICNKIVFIYGQTWVNKERLDKEKLGNSEPGPITNMPVHLINSEQIGFSEQLCDDQKVPYYQV